MTTKRHKFIKLGLLLVIIVACVIIATGFNRKIAASNNETYKSLKTFTDVLEIVEKNYVDEVDTKDLINKAIQGMVHGLDPHSALLPPEAFDELQIDTKGEFGGIGIVITMQKGILTVISPIEGTPAFKAGIEAQDKIIKVDGESTQDMKLWEAVKKMRGPKGKEVIITVVRKGVPKPIEFKLIRDIIPVESVRSIVLKPGYGYIRITNFQANTETDILTELKKMESGKVALKGLILDLRNNPGGLLDQAIKVSDIFLENVKILSIKGRYKKNNKVFKGTPNTPARTYPIVVLINSGSASASEIVAGALQDNHRALILGTTSFGKGSVQTVEELPEGYGLKLTIARYYTPNGRSIQAKGIEPDIVIKHKIIEEDEENDDGVITEADLKNHLEAEPDASDKKETRTSDKKKRSVASKYGKLQLDNLNADYQVMRSLEILISYNIFKK
ncbi:S41 family peptidase [Desulfococcaceae bacterium HSG9]|nr:S41 family peptidase [Desulfococcaceae bacterium HSG9]